MAEVLIHSTLEQPWLQYAARQVFQRMLGWRIGFTTEKETALASSVPVIDYSPASIGKGSHVPPATDEQVIDDPKRDPVRFTWMMLNDGIAMHEPDEHGRSRLQSMIAFKKGWLDRPIVDEVAIDLALRMAQELPGLPPVRRRYTHIATLDVDNGFKYFGRPLWRTLGSSARDLLTGRFAEVRDRIATLSGARRDPYDVYDDFRSITSANADRVIANFLVAPRGEHDHAVGLSSRRMIERMRSMAPWCEPGLHPSYHSSEREDLVARERDMLRQAIGVPVTISRQHFLRFRHPDTFLELERAGIKEDHSVGLSDAIGFRAGTCTPFPFYDLENERETDLMIFPFQVMDSALCYKMKLDPDEAIAVSRRVVDKVKAVQGTFIGVWHERFISDHGAEKGWRRVVEEVIRYAKP